MNKNSPRLRKRIVSQDMINRVTSDMEWQRHCYLEYIYFATQVFIQYELHAAPPYEDKEMRMPRPEVRTILKRESEKIKVLLRTSSLSFEDASPLRMQGYEIDERLELMSDADDRINPACALREKQQKQMIDDQVDAIHNMDAPQHIKDAHFRAMLREHR